MIKNYPSASSSIDWFNPLFDYSLPDPLKVTLLQLIALSWGSPAQQTPPVSYAHLEELMGKPGRTIRGHIATLRDYHAALDTRRADVGQFIIVLADRFFTPSRTAWGTEARTRPGQSLPTPRKVPDPPDPALLSGRIPPKFPKKCRISPASLYEEEVNELENSDPNLPLKKAERQKNSSAERQHWPARKNHPRPVQEPETAHPLPDAFIRRLLEAGVFPSLLGEVAASGYHEPDLRALLEWCQSEQPEKAAPLFIGRMRNGACAPQRFRAIACPVCGQRGEHAQGCYKKY